MRKTSGQKEQLLQHYYKNILSYLFQFSWELFVLFASDALEHFRKIIPLCGVLKLGMSFENRKLTCVIYYKVKNISPHEDNILKIQRGSR